MFSHLRCLATASPTTTKHTELEEVNEDPAVVMGRSPKRSTSQHAREEVRVLLLSTHEIGGDHLLHFRHKKTIREGGRDRENRKEKGRQSPTLEDSHRLVYCFPPEIIR